MGLIIRAARCGDSVRVDAQGVARNGPLTGHRMDLVFEIEPREHTFVVMNHRERLTSRERFEEVSDVEAVKVSLEIARDLASRHAASVGGYVAEATSQRNDVRKLLRTSVRGFALGGFGRYRSARYPATDVR